MSYIDAYRDEKDTIHVIERNAGKRVYRDYKAKYVLYYEDAYGDSKSLWGTPCKKYTSNNNKEFKRQKSLLFGKNLHESDINPVFRCLEENYLDKESPILNISFFDIETDFDPNRGFADPWDPFSRITAITIYHKWLDKLITFALKPDVPENSEYFLTFQQAENITNKFENCYLCDSEELLLELFLETIKDSDVLSGWNSTGYDIPYTINRCKKILGKESIKRFNAFDVYPKIRTYVKFKKEHKTYDLSGIVHLDYLDLYKKHAPAEMSSYRLDYIGEVEVGDHKVQYDGTLDMLYKKDFEKFIEYNRQDVVLLNKIDNKLKYIELANQIAHTNTVLLQTTMGSVALVEQSIINEVHKMGMVVPNRKSKFDNFEEDYEEELDDLFDINKGPAVGAHVADPKVGLHVEIGCCDINSLYPSAIRSLNMSPETLVGQIRNDRTNEMILSKIKKGMSVPEAWHNVFCLIEFDLIRDKTDDILYLDLIDGTTLEMTAREINEMIFSKDSNFVLSANCTIFDKSKKGIIPDLLEKWYSERKQLQANEKVCSNLQHNGINFDLDDSSNYVSNSIDNINKIPEYIINKDVGSIKYFINENVLVYKDGKLYSTDEYKNIFKEQESFWNQRQQARKILLNSLYGALLNAACRFNDQRVGQSVTLSGRSIVKHMNSKINEIITGEYQIDGDSIIYMDTDSVDKSTLIETDLGTYTIENLFNLCSSHKNNGTKEYAFSNDIKTLGYNPDSDTIDFKNFNYIYRHKVKKKKFKITDCDGNSVIVTEDHSIMIERDSILIEVKPMDIMEGDIIISYERSK